MTIAPPPRRGSATGLPGPIRGALRRVDRRLRAALALRGVGVALIASAAIAGGAMAVDLVRPLPGAARWAAWLAWVTVSGILAIAAVARPIGRRHPRAVLAAVAGRACADRGDRLAAAVALAEQGGRAHGSPELIAALVDRAAAEAEGIDPSRAVPLLRGWRRLGVGLAAAGLVALPAVAKPDPFEALALRFLRPWDDPGTAALLAIAVEPGDAVIARGDPLAVSAAVRSRVGGGLPESARIEWTAADGSAHALEMGPGLGAGEGRRFAITLPGLSGPISYRVVSGVARSPSYRVEVADPPRVASLRLTITPPPYTGRDSETLVDPEAAVAWQDSTIAIVAETDRPARGVALMWPTEGGEGMTIALRSSGGGTSWTAEASASASGAFAIESRDERGLIGRPGRSGRLEVVLDAPPVVALGDRPGAAGPGDRLPLPVAARDDLAVVSAELHYEIRRSGPDGPPEAGALAIDLDGLGSPEARGIAELDLAPLGLGDGDLVSVRARVVDNRPPPRGPNEGWSAPSPIAVAADVARSDAERLEESLRPLRERLDALAGEAAEAHRGAGSLREAAEEARTGPAAWDEERAGDLDRLERAARDLADRLRRLAEAMEEDPTLGMLAEALREAAGRELAAASDALGDSRRAEGADDRLDGLGRAEAELGAASAGLDGLGDRLDDLARAAAARPELADLAARESELADRAEALADPAESPIDPDALRDLRDAQQALAEALDDLLRRAPGLEESAAEAQANAEAAGRDLDRARDPSRSSESARAAAEAMRRAAEQLRRASGPADPSSRLDRLAQTLDDGAPSDSPPVEGEPTATPPVAAEAGASDPGADLDLRSERAWGALPGHLRTEILRSSPDRYHPDYAALIRLYFLEIARGASESEEPRP